MLVYSELRVSRFTDTASMIRWISSKLRIPLFSFILMVAIMSDDRRDRLSNGATKEGLLIDS